MRRTKLGFRRRDGEERKKVVIVMEKLPQELIIDILSRLPTLSLLQSTRVCRSWHQIITTDPIFTTLRYNRSPISTDALFLTNSKRLYFNQLIKPHSSPNIDLSSFLHGINTERFDLKVIGVCNGLICFATFPKVIPRARGRTNNFYRVHSFHIINPISKEKLQLPKFPKSLKIGSTSKIESMIYEFGFDKRNQVFKLVFFVFGLNENVKKLLLFTLEGVASRWRSVSGNVVPCMMRYAFSNASSIYVDGCLHWITRNTMPNSTDRTLVIMSFNLSDEAFGVIQTPELVVVDHHSVHELAVLDNSLCWVDSESNNHINIWIKKGDESWTKSFCLQKSIVAPPSFGPVTPIKFEQNGRLFLKNRKCVACYDVQDNTATFFDVNYGDPQRDSYPDVFPFVGSFISINSH